MLPSIDKQKEQESKVLLCEHCKGLFTPSESESNSEKDQTTRKRDQRINDKDQRKFSLSFPLSLGVNGP